MDPRYPVGKFAMPISIAPALRQAAIEEIACAPVKVRSAVTGLTDSQLETPYREGGWTVRQVVHHMADSHMNAYIRLRLALTETEPTIKAYQEADWARLDDAQHAPVEISLKLLDPLQDRYVCFAFQNNSNIRSRLKKESTWRDPQEPTQFLKLQWATSFAGCLKKKHRRPLKTLSASPKAPRNSRTSSAERRKSGPITTA